MSGSEGALHFFRHAISPSFKKLLHIETDSKARSSADLANRPISAVCDNFRLYATAAETYLMGPAGFEPATKTPRKTGLLKYDGAECGAQPASDRGIDALAAWIEACPIAVPNAMRAGILAMVKAITTEEPDLKGL